MSCMPVFYLNRGIFLCAFKFVICQFLQSQNIQKSLKVIRYTLKIPLLALIHKKTIILDIYIDTLILVANVKHQNSLLQILVSINSNFAFWNSLDHKTFSALFQSVKKNNETKSIHLYKF